MNNHAKVWAMLGRNFLLSASLVFIVPALVFATEAVLPDFGWTISESATDPLDNFGPATTDTLTLYLWLYCTDSSTGGVSGATLWLNYDPNLEVFPFEPQSGVVHSGSLVWELDLSLPDCPPGSFLAGSFKVRPLVGSGYFELCLQGDIAGSGPSTSYGCAAPNVPRDNATIGYGAGYVPCIGYADFFDHNCFPAVPVIPNSWGRIKAHYSR
jgi:hypothetical protein